MYKEIRRLKGFRHIQYRSVYRRVEALEKQGWIVQNGTRPAQPGWDTALYSLTPRAKAALRLDKKSIDDFLQTATDEQLCRFIDALDEQ